ncbi:hypothetical protein EVA_20070 [gut metagenome]|uniref:Uncharacterized protein n=1 Tax=gut metagenome TaxID=749906 RepID=J9FBL2_9ZZZZ
MRAHKGLFIKAKATQGSASPFLYQRISSLMPCRSA